MPEAPKGDATSINRVETEMAQISRQQRMKEYFAEQPKETIKIRKDLGEQWVQINGYAFRIQAGERVKVPVDVADQLRNAEII
jgi:hypothetical protein